METTVLEFLSRFGPLDIIVISINLILMMFAKRIMRIIYHGTDDDKRFMLRVRIFRAFNLAIMLAFSYYHLVLPVKEKGPGIKILATIIVLYLGFVVIHAIATFIHTRYGKTKIIEGNKVVIETYNSRLISILSTVFLSVVLIIAVVRILGFDSWLEAGGVLGVIGVLLALTQNVWAPDLFSGLIMLNSGMLETGDVVEFPKEDQNLSVVYKTRLFHTELLNLVNNHRLMIRNANLRDMVIHNLSKFASARGLRERLTFKIGYDVSPEKARKTFERAFDKIGIDKEINVETAHGIEVRTKDAGDFAVEYAVFFYTKDVRNILRCRYSMIEAIIAQSENDGVNLWTPAMLNADVNTIKS